MKEHEVFLLTIPMSLVMLFHWQVWLVFVLNIFANAGLLLGIGLIGGKFLGEEKKGGCLFLIITGLIQGIGRAFLMAASVGYLLPILCGHPDGSTQGELMQYLPQLFVSSIYASMTVFLLCVIPIIGPLLTASGPGVQCFIQSSMIFSSIAKPDIAARLSEVPVSVRGALSAETFLPNGWIYAGYLVIAAILTYGIIIGAVLIESLYMRIRNIYRPPDEPSIAITIVGPSIGVIAALVTLLMYASYSIGSMYNYTKKEEKLFASALEAENYVVAVDHASAIIPFDPRPRYLALRAFAYNHASKPTEALADSETALEKEPDNFEALTQKSVALMRLGRSKEALRVFNKLVDLKPTDPEVLAGRGLVLFEVGEFERGIKDFNVFLNDGNIEDQLKVPIYNTRAMGYYLKADYKSAIADCTVSINLDKSSGDAFHCRSLAYKKLGQTNLSEQDAAKANKLGWTKVPWFRE